MFNRHGEIYRIKWLIKKGNFQKAGSKIAKKNWLVLLNTQERKLEILIHRMNLTVH